jgi:FAD-dependent urate hydroxylase
MESDTTRATAATAECDVAVVGAGPYGLSVAAHLRGRGLRVVVFGKPFETWRRHMPKGMFLRSHSWASNLSDPEGLYGFKMFAKVVPGAERYPVPLASFIEYGLWFQKHAVPEVDETYVSSIQRERDDFVLTLEDGRVVRGRAVVMAIGLPYYARVPTEFQGFPPTLVSHSSQHDGFDRFRGAHVVVIGGGQSALEYAALLHEAGAAVDVVARRPVDWLPPDRYRQRNLVEQIRAPDNGIGPGWLNWVLQYLPLAFYRLPDPMKRRLVDWHVRNWGVIAWVKDRVLGKVNVHDRATVSRLAISDGGLNVTLSDGATLRADHVLVATGYEVDIGRLPMIHPRIRRSIQTNGGSPVLSRSFETSVPGLYFVGPTAVRSFGPLFRFVLGCRATGPRLARAVSGRVRARHEPSIGARTEASSVALDSDDP